MAVSVTINHKTLVTEPGPTIFDCAEKLDVRVPTSCYKQGKCRECMVEVVEGMELLSPQTEQERHLPANYRLSCRTQIVGTDGALTCHTMRRAAMRVMAHGTHAAIQDRPDPLDPAVTRDGERILLDGREIARSTAPIHGIAVDVGTTTVVMRLVNLETGEIVATQSFENPQRFGGSDVMARIRFDTENKGHLLQRTLHGYMHHVIEEFPCDPQTIYEIAIAGNTTMRDLFFGLNVHPIGQKPYHSTTQTEFRAGTRASTSVATTARALRFPIHPEGRIFSLPLIGAHVGADMAACMLAIDIAHEDRTVALMDIGTNTELVIGNRQRVLAASCPAGPAFEGGAISCGMPGLEGAIEEIVLRPNGELTMRVIGDVEPEGICGSGLIDLLGELLRTGRMNGRGRLADKADRFVVDAKSGLAILESDIGALSQAKAANASGLHIVFDQFGIRFDQVDVFYLAGAFATHIRTDAARRIGLIPNVPDAKVVQLGNASIVGVTKALLSRALRNELEDLARRVEHVELETDPHFFDYFVEGCQFQPVDPIDRASAFG